MLKIVWLKLLPTPLSIHTSLLLGRLSIGCLLKTVPYSKLSYWCTSSCIVAIQTILCFSLNLDIVSITHVKAKLMVCSLRPHTLSLQYKSSKHFSLSFACDAPKIWNDFSGGVRSATSLHSFTKSSKPISLHKHIHPNFSFFQFLSVVPNLAMSQANDCSFLLFCLVHLESVF